MYSYSWSSDAYRREGWVLPSPDPPSIDLCTNNLVVCTPSTATDNIDLFPPKDTHTGSRQLRHSDDIVLIVYYQFESTTAQCRVAQ